MRRRRFGDVVRVEVACSMSRGMVERLCHGLGVERRPDLRDPRHARPRRARRRSPSLDRPELKYEPWLGVTPPRLRAREQPRDLFAEIRRADVFVHHPYESFATSFERFVAAAAADPDVSAMKTTVYRTSGDCPLVPRADRVRGGRQAERLPRRAEGPLRRAPQHRVGTRARAGGRARRLRLPRPEDPREDDARRPARGRRLRRYVHIGTGNYHAVTARCTRTSASSRPTRRSPPTSPTSSTT